MVALHYEQSNKILCSKTSQEDKLKVQKRSIVSNEKEKNDLDILVQALETGSR